MSESTFRHTTARVPRLYKEAGKIVQKVREEGGSFKSLVFQSKHRSLLKSLYALVAETLRHGSELDALLRQTQMLIKEPRLDPWLARVLITELVWKQRPLAGPAVPLKIVQSYKSELLSKHSDSSSQLVKPVTRASRPRFVRINTLKATVQEVLDYFVEEGWNAVRMPTNAYTSTSEENQYANFLEKISLLSDNEFLQDLHVPNLLIFPGNMEFYNFEYYHNGSLLLQDKASCMSAHLLDAPPGSIVLDMCAAPGMKTTHIAALLKNEGTLYAVEKHPARYESLCNVVSQSGASCVKPILGSSLHVSDIELPDVEYIIVDPTCSGSGMTNRKEIFNDLEDVSSARLEKLSSFQCAILRHAMTNFPKVKRIVYSTCSIFPEENEAVIENVLKVTSNFQPVISSRGTQWMKRGSSAYNCGEYGLYARPDIDMTNGFFVVVFERTENEYVPSETILKPKNGPCSKKKKNRGPSGKSEKRSQPEAITNPALERMKKAMGSLCVAAEKNSVELQTEEINNKSKNKRKKHNGEKYEWASGSMDPVEQTMKKKKKRRENVLSDDGRPLENAVEVHGEAVVEDGLQDKKVTKRKHKDSRENIDTGEDGNSELPSGLQRKKESHCVKDEPGCDAESASASSKKSKKKKKRYVSDAD